MAKLLGTAELTRRLADLPGWTGDQTALEYTVEAPDFPTAIRIVDAVALIAEEMDHHPDIDIRWRRLRFRLSTHTAGGVTPLDIELAHHISAAVQARR